MSDMRRKATQKWLSENRERFNDYIKVWRLSRIAGVILIESTTEPFSGKDIEEVRAILRKELEA